MAGFGHSRRATFNVESATFNIDVMAQQNGSEIEEGVSSVTTYDIMTVGTDGALATKFTALGVTGQEIGKIYKLDDDGTQDAVFTQAASAATGSFAYATATKAITFDTAETPIAGDRYVAIYEYKPAGSKRIGVSGEGIPSVVYVTAFGLVKDTCSSKLYPAQIEGRAQIDGNWSFDITADGDPAIHALNMEFVRGCLEKELYTFTVYTEEEATD